MIDPTEIGINMRSLRERRNWSQRQLAQAAGVDNATISKLEKGSIPSPGIVVLSDIARVLGTQVGFLIGEEKRIEEARAVYEADARILDLPVEEWEWVARFAERMMLLPEGDRVTAKMWIDEYLRMKMFEVGDREAHPPRIVGDAGER